MLEDNKHIPPSDMRGVNSMVERVFLQARWLQTGRSLWQMRDLTFHLKKHARNHTGSRLASGCQPCGMQHVSPARETNVKPRSHGEEVSGVFREWSKVDWSLSESDWHLPAFEDKSNQRTLSCKRGYNFLQTVTRWRLDYVPVMRDILLRSALSPLLNVRWNQRSFILAWRHFVFSETTWKNSRRIVLLHKTSLHPGLRHLISSWIATISSFQLPTHPVSISWQAFINSFLLGGTKVGSSCC